MSKGSTRRPTTEQAYAQNWDKIFGKENKDLRRLVKDKQKDLEKQALEPTNSYTHAS